MRAGLAALVAIKHTQCASCSPGCSTPHGCQLLQRIFAENLYYRITPSGIGASGLT